MDEFDKKHQFLVKEVYYELENLNTGFDSPFIYYFNESDFEEILNRCEKLDIIITGLEPWLNGEYYDVQVREEHIESLGDNWYSQIFENYKSEGFCLQYSASYYIPKELLK